MDNNDYTLPTTTTILKDYYTDNEAIDHFCDRLQFKKPSWPTTKVGRFAIVDPDVKDMKRGVDKLWAKLKDANLPDHMLNNPNANVFNLITDYARCSILMPDFREAPALITNFLQQVGGEVSHHNRDDYKAFHLHTNVNGINCEFQFHTFDTYDLKRATDGHYHKWRHAKERDAKAVEANPEYQAEQNFLRPICQNKAALTKPYPPSKKLSWNAAARHNA